MFGLDMADSSGGESSSSGADMASPELALFSRLFILRDILLAVLALPQADSLA